MTRPEEAFEAYCGQFGDPPWSKEEVQRAWMVAWDAALTAADPYMVHQPFCAITAHGLLREIVRPVEPACTCGLDALLATLRRGT